MVDEKILKAQAKSQLDVLVMLLICGVILGALFEYHHATTPLAETILIYQSGHQSGNLAEPQAQENNQKQANVASQEQPAKEQTLPDNNAPAAQSNQLSEFLSYMHQIQEDIARLEPEATVLDKINVTVVPSEQSENKLLETTENPVPVNDENKTAPVDEVVNATEEISAAIDAEKQAASEVTEAMRERVTEEINELEAEGEEKPIVLIPGMMTPVESSEPQE